MNVIYLFVCLFVAVLGSGDMGPGSWTVLQIQDCANPDQYKFRAEVERKKMNRTHEGYSALLVVPEDLDELNYAVRVDVCKYVDSGCNPYQKLSDDCACCFMNKYAKSNVESVLGLANLDPPNCPVPKGTYTVENYIMDFSVFPDKCMYGKYRAEAYLIDRLGTDLGCISVIISFDECDDCE